MGAQGPGCAPPMPEGGSEDRGPRSAAGPNQTPPGPCGPEPRTGVGGGGVGALTVGGPGEAQGGRAPRPPHPSPQPQAQACTPDRPLGVPETLRAPGPGQVCWPGLPVCGDWEASAGLPALAGAPRGKVRPAGSTRHIRAKSRHSAGFLKAPGGNRLHLRSYHPERARCLLIGETKQG
ncbi:unnamed protein product [Rangifer tarandus platyrhynchus]|uniref:Uncharacterized protein n=1 Tax=Rangifer tarandus platyrhynchus TaxID=3082113 RepID=A0ABN8XNK6_RANTA|nr:unnamed protein product [Rangifer tarandus platyrhynchus]